MINRHAYNADLNIYFHMKNHYRKLRNVKSIIDNSTPQGFHKSCPTPANSPSSIIDCRCNERSAKCSQILKPNNDVHNAVHNTVHNAVHTRVHHSVGSQSERSVRSNSLPPRPITRRHPFEMPQIIQCKMRSQSVGPLTRKDVSVRLNNYKHTKKNRSSRRKSKEQQKEIVDVQNKTDTNPESNETKSKKHEGSKSPRRNRLNKSNKGKSCSRTEEQEYLQFLLRITEDIIINNYHTGEDVEKVFQNHVQANKGHLKMVKMRAQLARLCGELNIPYNNNEKLFKKEDCYQNFFETDSYNSNCHRNFDKCECVTNRTLEFGSRDHVQLLGMMEEGKEDSNLSLENDMQVNFDILMSKNSLSRVTECTEPSNSQDTLMTSTKRPSGTTVSSFGNIDVLPGLETTDIKVDKQLFEEVVGKSLSHEILAIKELPLTEKEKYGSMVEEFMFQKYNNMLPREFANEYHDDIILRNAAFVTVIQDDNSMQSKELNTQESTVEDVESTNDPKLNINENLINIHVTESPKNSSAGAQGKDNTERRAKVKLVVTDPLKTNHHIQTKPSASCMDKQCNTSLRLQEQIKNDDYILVNGPMYILKTLLNPNERFIIYSDTTALENVIRGDNALEISSKEPVHFPKNNLSRLLNSDYDLTPQRDEGDDSAKYHHLAVDATTSMSAMHINKTLLNVNYSGLLLTDGYTITDRMEFETNGALNSDKFVLSNHEVSRDGLYDLKSYTIPQEGNGSVRIADYSVVSRVENENGPCDQVAELGVSLGEYEIHSQDDNFSENSANVDVSEEVTKTEEDKTDLGTEDESPRCDSGRISNRSHNVMNILRKRKIKHS